MLSLGRIGSEMKKELYQKWFRKDNLIIIFLVGVLLMVISWPSKGKEQKDTENRSGSSVNMEKNSADPSGKNYTGAENIFWETYLDQQEKKLQSLLETMEGIGKVQIMITVRSSEELVVEKECPVDRKETKEQDSNGGSRFVNEVHTTENIIYADMGNMSNKSNTPLVVKTILPQIRGVAVVAQGAENIEIRQSVTEIIKSLYGLESYQVKVVAMK